MRQIFEGDVHDIVAMENGVCFVFTTEQEGNDLAHVEFKSISFETGKMSRAPKNVYFLAKFGTRHKTIIKHCNNFAEARILDLPQERVFILNNDDGSAVLLDNFGLPLWISNVSYKGAPPSDVAFVQGSLWASFKEQDAIIKFNLANMREELRIGGGKNSPFMAPVKLTPTENGIAVLNGGDRKLIELNLKDYSLNELYSFDEPVKKYLKVGTLEFIVLKSGLYLL